MDWDVGKGRAFSYFTFGAAFAEAEIDCLTGDFHLPRVDIVMDLGNSLNPAIDIGQVCAREIFRESSSWSVILFSLEKRIWQTLMSRI